MLYSVVLNDVDQEREVRELGGNPNQVNTDVGSSLENALFQSTPEMVTLLLSHGADTTVNSQDGRTLIEIVETMYGPSKAQFQSILEEALKLRTP